MSCPYFKEGYFGLCVAPEAIHVPGITEMESFCFKEHYQTCPSFSDVKEIGGAGMASHAERKSEVRREARTPFHFAW